VERVNIVEDVKDLLDACKDAFDMLDGELKEDK
jgi:hypothetical protein